MAADAERAVRKPTRWSLREVDGPGEESLYDGMETDASGDWVRAEDADHAIEAVRRDENEACQRAICNCYDLLDTVSKRLQRKIDKFRMEAKDGR